MKTNDSIARVEKGAAANAHSDRTVLPNLDGIRASACLIVVPSHTPLLKGLATLGSIGVGRRFSTIPSSNTTKDLESNSNDNNQT